jgi:ABC-type tungstate transport system permease subunit
MNFTEAYSHCNKMTSELWQVIDGESEWNAVYEKAKQGIITIIAITPPTEITITIR